MLFVRTFIKNIHSYANVSSEPEKIPRIKVPIPLSINTFKMTS